MSANEDTPTRNAQIAPAVARKGSAWQMTVSDERRLGRAVRDRAFWTPTRIAGVAFILVGAVGAISVVAARGLTSAAEAPLVTTAALTLVGVGALFAPRRGDSGGARTVQLILWMVAALVLVNMALAWINLDLWGWRAPMLVPSIDPIGIDFRASYAAAQQFSVTPTSWPPFTVVLATPYLLLGPNAACVVHVGVLIALNVGALGLAAAVLRSQDVDGRPLPGPAVDHVGLLAPAFAVWLFVSYGFLFSVERGNYDAFPAFLAMLGLWSLVRRPAGVWLPVIAFSLAASIKVYPALLLLLVLWRFRWKSVVPLIVCNVALALSAGPENLARFLSGVTSMQAGGMDYLGVGNSSGKSFSAWIDSLHKAYLPHLPTALLIAVPILVFGFTVWHLWRRRDHASTVLMLCAMVPLMFVVPSISHDYKLVLLAGPAVLLAGLLMRRIGRGSAEPWWMLLMLCLALFLVARPPGLVWPAILQNKYLPVLLFQIVVAWMAWRLPASVAPETAGGDLPPGNAPPKVAAIPSLLLDS